MSDEEEKLCVTLEEIQEKMSENMGPHFYSKQGVRINSAWWNILYNDKSYRRVELDTVDKYTIQTIWCGVDNREVKDGPPMLFETRIEDKDQYWIWPSFDIALAGSIHSIVVDQLRKGIHPENLEVKNPFN